MALSKVQKQALEALPTELTLSHIVFQQNSWTPKKWQTLNALAGQGFVEIEEHFDEVNGGYRLIRRIA